MAAYKKDWLAWHGLVSFAGGCFQDNDSLHIFLYSIVVNFEEGFSVSFLNRKLAGLAFLFKISGFSNVTKQFLVKQAVKGYRKGRRVPDSRRPVSFAILGRILEQLPLVCSSSYEAVLFKTAFVLAFLGL